MLFRGVLLGVAALALSTGAVARPKLPPPIKSPEFYAAAADIKDDALETVASISTYTAGRPVTGLFQAVNEDVFLRALIDKKTGEATFQVYQIVYYGGDWRFYMSANYEAPNGPKSVPADRISSEVVACSQYGCSHREDVGFDVPEDILRWVAARATPQTEVGEPWRFKWKAKDGSELLAQLPPAEVAGLLRAVEEYRVHAGLKRPSPKTKGVSL